MFRDVIVYGVEIVGTDGKAGMAAISNEDDTIDMDRVSAAVTSLPSYARPMFVRLLKNANSHLTGTYKLKKTDLQREAFDLAAIEDPLWFWDSASKKYQLMSHKIYTDIIQGNLQF